ncbi:MAG: hypothetical protein AAFQ07_14325 [Chloroflexota bacterium]
MKRDHLTEQDVAIAATLVYPHRATMVPDTEHHQIRSLQWSSANLNAKQ